MILAISAETSILRPDCSKSTQISMSMGENFKGRSSEISKFCFWFDRKKTS